MKKYFLLILTLSSFALALTDTDADGVSDDKDVCPRVYARSATGCPTLTKPVPGNTNSSCIEEQIKKGKMIATISPICDKNSAACTIISKVVGFQSCDPIFPIIFDKNGIPMIRGAVYIVDFTK